MTEKKPPKKASEMTNEEIAERAFPKEIREKIRQEANPPKKPIKKA